MNIKRSQGSTLADSRDLTVMVFKDNDTSRSFQVSLGWITRLGFGLGALAIAALLGSFFAVKFYRVARHLDPSHVIDLEQQLGDLKSANKGLEARLAAATAAGAAKGSVNPLPVPTVTVTVAAAAPAAETAKAAPAPAPAPAASVASVGGLPLFSALPRQTQDLSEGAAKLPITVSPARTSWSASGRTFKVDFNIQYVGSDHGSQQGRIIVLARGPNGLFAYPEGVLGRAGAESLIQPQQGEYFSVSRFREVKAEFVEVKGAGGIQDVEILIMSLENQLLFYQKIAAAPAPGSAKPAPAKSASAPAKTAQDSSATPAATQAGPGATAAPPSAKKPSASKPAAPKAAAAAKPAAPAATGTAPSAGNSKPDSSELIEPGVDQ